MERSPGSTILGRLELIREETPSVGVQVFGPTWAVLDTETGELARACVLDTELLPDPPARAAFEAGLAALSSLREPTLVPQLIAGVDDHGGAVLYEPTPGGVAFDDLFDGTGSFELPVEVGRLARQLARALAALHGRGQVHGMLASACVFVGPRGPAVYQYGLAPLCDRSVLLRRVRAFGLSNLAPEVMEGGGFTPSADLYAWAVTVAQFASGVRGAAALDVARSGEDLPGLTPSLRAAVQACLADDPAARPRDGVELLRVIETAGLGEGSGTLTRPDAAAGSGESQPVETITTNDPEASALSATATTSTVAPVAAASPVTSTAPMAVSVAASAGTAARETSKPRPSVPLATRPSVPKDRPPTIPPAGMSLPVTSFEEMLMTGDRARRPGTIPPGSLNVAQTAPAAASSARGVIELAPEDLLHESGSWTRGGQPSGKSASNLRRVHLLTDPVKRTSEANAGASSGRPVAEEVSAIRPVEPGEAARGEVIIGGTREELDAASRATTLRLDPSGAAEAVKAANAAATAAREARGEGERDEVSRGDAVRRSEANAAAPRGDLQAPSAEAPRVDLQAPSAEAPRADLRAPSLPVARADLRAPSTAAPAAETAASQRRSAAVESGTPVQPSGSGPRRRSSAVSTAGHAEPQDWGTIPPIQDLVVATPIPVPAPSSPAADVVDTRKSGPSLLLIAGVMIVIIIIIVVWAT